MIGHFQARAPAELPVVVEAVPGSSPVAHPYEVAAEDGFDSQAEARGGYGREAGRARGRARAAHKSEPRYFPCDY
jgi:hypothetical protein